METKKSIITDKCECYVCGSPVFDIHHIFFGVKNRNRSDEYGLIVPLCRNHHTGKMSPHQNKEFDLAFKKIGQKAFQDTYPMLNFVELFGKNYL